MKIWSSRTCWTIFSNCLMNLKNSGDSMGFEPMTSTMLVQTVLEPTELRSHTVESRPICWAHVFPWKECRVKGMSYERNVIWSVVFEIKWRYDRHACWSHLNFSGSWDNCLNCPASARIISSFDFKHRTSYKISFIKMVSKKSWWESKHNHEVITSSHLER